VNELERQLLQEEVGDAEPRLCVRSRSRIDAGRWRGRTPAWLCVVGAELVILAVARRRFVARLAISDCAGSHYSHASGEFVIEPSGDLQFSRFQVSPLEAIQLAESMNLQPAGTKF
jgi:hypothetical protein